jgi:hypothetical protein
MRAFRRFAVIISVVLSILPVVGFANEVIYDIDAGEYRITEDKEGFHTIHMLTPGYGGSGSSILALLLSRKKSDG